MDEYEKAVRYWKGVYIGSYFVFPLSFFVFYSIFDFLCGGDLIVSGIRNFYRNAKHNPLLLLIFVFLLFSAWFVYRIQMNDRVERLRYRYRRCHKCGYDMRHVPENCPECGHKVDPLDTWWYEITEEKRGK